MRNSIFILLFVGLLACNGPAHDPVVPDPDLDETPPESSAPGFGSSKSRPEGTPFAFPEGVTLARKPRFDGDCWYEAKKNKKIKGSGAAVAFCLTLHNANAYPVVVQIPPGLIWVAEKNETLEDISQSGIIVKTVTVHIPAHMDESVWMVAYCINYDRSGSRQGDTFEMQPILSNHPGVRALTAQLATKKINEEEFLTEPTDAERQQLAFVQIAVKDVETYGTVQPRTQTYLDKLPNAN